MLSCVEHEKSFITLGPESSLSPENTLEPWIIHILCEDSDQTARMRRVVLILAGSTCNLVGNAVSRHSVYMYGW